MLTKCSVYIAASVDGFIARLDGGIEWLDKAEYSATPTMGLSYEEFISTVDAIVMGRHSFEKVLSFGFWPYEGMPVVVLSSRPLPVPAELMGKVRQASGDPHTIIANLAQEGMQHFYIDGGLTIQQFLAAKLINEITITRIPVLLGSGIPLFGKTFSTQELTLLQAVVSENGFVQERYAVNN